MDKPKESSLTKTDKKLTILEKEKISKSIYGSASKNSENSKSRQKDNLFNTYKNFASELKKNYVTSI